MSNMSHCRFQNTLMDLKDCLENLGDTDLSEREAAARTKLIKLAAEITERASEILECADEIAEEEEA